MADTLGAATRHARRSRPTRAVAVPSTTRTEMWCLIASDVVACAAWSDSWCNHCAKLARCGARGAKPSLALSPIRRHGRMPTHLHRSAWHRAHHL